MHISNNILAINNITIQIITVICCLSYFNKNLSYCDDYNNNINNVLNNNNINYVKFLNTSSNNYSKINNNKSIIDNINSNFNNKCKNNNITQMDSNSYNNDNINGYKKCSILKTNNDIKLYNKNIIKHSVTNKRKSYDNEFNLKLNRYIRLAKKFLPVIELQNTILINYWKML